VADPKRPPALLAALLAAQADAHEIEATERGVTRRRSPQGEDGEEEEWFYPPAAAVLAEYRRLRAAHGVTITLTSQVATGDMFEAEYQLVHTSGASMPMSYRGPQMSPAKYADKPHVVTATERYAFRCIVLRVFDIPIRYPARPPRGERGQDGPTPATPGGWPAPPSAPEEPTASGTTTFAGKSHPPFSPAAVAAALEPWVKSEREMRSADLGLQSEPTMVDAWRLCRAHQGLGVVDGSRPNSPSEFEELYRFLCDQADEYGWTFKVST